MTAWHRNEYILKGLFLGLWVFFALQVHPNSVRRVDRHLLGSRLGLHRPARSRFILGAFRLASRGLKPWDNPQAFPLLVLLESPQFIYGGIMLGLFCGVLSGRAEAEPFVKAVGGWFGDPERGVERGERTSRPLAAGSFCAVGGAILGLGLYQTAEDGSRACTGCSSAWASRR